MQIQKLNLTKPIVDATASEIAGAIRMAVKQTGKKVVKGEITKAAIIKDMPDSFTKAGKITDAGKEQLGRKLADLGLTINSTLQQLVEAFKTLRP